MPALPLARATCIRAFAPFATAEEARDWLGQTAQSNDAIDGLIEEALTLLNRALHVYAVAAADPHVGEIAPTRAAAIRIGYGSGEEVAAGEFSAAFEVEIAQERRWWQRRRGEDLRPQERTVAVLTGRERLDACETLLRRARADLDAGREREAALQLRAGLEALLVELEGAVADPGHEKDLATLRERRAEAGDAAEAALRGDLGPKAAPVSELLEISERVLRRRRVLRG